MRAKARRIICPGCQKSCSVRQDGKIRDHIVWGIGGSHGMCKMSGEPVMEDHTAFSKSSS